MNENLRATNGYRSWLDAVLLCDCFVSSVAAPLGRIPSPTESPYACSRLIACLRSRKEGLRTYSVAPTAANAGKKKLQLVPGDVLGVYIEGVLGDERGLAARKHTIASANVPPSIGYPIPVRSRWHDFYSPNQTA